MADTLHGLGVSAGAAAGAALRMGHAPRLPAPRTVADPETERSTVRDALEHVAAFTQQAQVLREAGGGAREQSPGAASCSVMF